MGINAGTIADHSPTDERKTRLDNSEDEGRFRTNDDIYVVDNLSGEVVHFPVPYTEIPELILLLCRLFNEKGSENFVHPIIKGTLIHFLLAYIHPFCDGNGRTAVLFCIGIC